MSFWRPTSLFIVVAFTAVALFGCGTDGAVVEDPLISVSPSEITFDSVLMGSFDTKILIISNEGQGDLVIDSITIEGDSTGDLRLDVGFTDILTIEPGSDHPINIVYEPTQAVLLDATIVIHSNDRDRTIVRVPVGTTGLFPFIAVNPEVVDFGRVVEATESTIEVTITNRGTAPLRIDSLEVIGSMDFSADFSHLEFPVELDVWVADDPNQQATTSFEVTYLPPSPGPDEGSIAIEYNSIDSTNFLVPLTGEGGLPDLTVSPNPIDFGPSPIGITSRKTVTITNTGNLSVEINRISFEPDTSDTFELGDLASELQIEAGGVTLAPNGSLPFIVSYTPLSETTHVGRVFIEHSNGLTPVILHGAGVDNRCPVAVARGFIRDDPQQRRDHQIDWATPTDTLILDGSGSFDPDGEIVSHQWELISSPGGTTTTLRPLEGFADDDSRRQFFIPLSGTYEFRLTVVDDVGFQDCDDPATVTVLSLPDERIHIELSWRNRLDFDETDDQGADVDLHFVKVGHNWFDDTFDTYYANDSPEWHPELPSLDIDDTDGRGPENIQMDNPLDCQWYAIGAHYFERQFGTAYADIRIYIDGVQIGQLTNRPLENTDDFWDMGRLHWPSGVFKEVDEIYTGFDSHSAVPPSILPEWDEEVSSQCN